MKAILLLALILASYLSYAAPVCDNEVYFNFDQYCESNSENQLNQRLSLTVTRRHSHKGCNYFLTFSKGSSPTYNRRLYHFWWFYSVPFQFYQDNSNTLVLMDYPELSSTSNVLTGSFPEIPFWAPDGVLNNTHYFKASFPDPNDSYPKGLYLDSFIVRLYSGTPFGEHELRDSQYLYCSYRKSNTLALSIVDVGAPFDEYSSGKNVNFGSMSTGQTQSFDVIIKSSAGYRLYFSSENGSALVHSAQSDSKVSYTVSVGGTPYSLPAGASVQVAQSTGETASEGSRSNIVVKLGTIAKQTAGSYSDNITVTVQTND